MTTQGRYLGRPYALVLILLVLISGIGAEGYRYYDHQKERFTRERQDELAAIAELKVKEISWWRKEHLEDAAAILKNPLVVGHVHLWLKDPGALEIRGKTLEWMASLKEHSDVKAVLLADAGGALRLSVPEQQEIDPHLLDLFHEALRIKKPLFSDLYRSDPTEEIRLSLIIPLIPAEPVDGPAIGAILLRIDPHQFLYPLLQFWPTPSASSETLLVRREGDEVLFLNELRHRQNAALALRLPLGDQQLPAAMAVRGQPGMVEGTDYRGSPVLAAIRPIPDSAWFLVAKVDKEEIYAPLNQSARMTGSLVAALIAGIVLSAGLIWRHQRALFYRGQYEMEHEKLELAQRYEYLTKFANDIILLVDMPGNIVEANDRAAQVYGFTRDELLRLNIKDLLTPASLPIFSDRLKSIQEQDGWVFESMHRRKDGSSFPVEVSSRLVQLGDHQYFWAITRDISERKEAEELFSKAFRSSPSVMTISTLKHGRLVEVNESFTTAFGYERHEVIGRTVSDLNLWVDPTQQARVVAALSRETALHNVEVLFRRKSGETFVGLASGDLIQYKGEPCVVAAFNDITDLKQAEQSLHESERRFREILENADFIAVMLDTQGNITFCNDFLLELTSWKREEVLGRSWFDHFVPVEARQEVESVFSRTIMTSTFPTHYENDIQTRQGKRHSIYWNNTILRDDQGRVIGTTSIGEDVTERKRLESQLRQAQKMEAIGTMAGGIAHDFNNILGAIMGYAEMALYDAPPGALLHSNLKEVLAAADRAKELVKQILTFSRQSEQQRRPSQILLLVEEALKLIRASLPATITIQGNLTTALRSMVLADPTQIHQVLMNLCANAAHAMREAGGVLDVGLEDVDLDPITAASCAELKPGPYVRLTVSDTGQGIDRGIMERIFEPFFTTRGPREGTGMGLAVVHGIVKSHGGAITVYSEPGQGSTFHIYLPRLEGSAAGQVEEPVTISAGQGRILLVDDEETLVDIGQQMLEHLGYEVVGRTSSIEALAVFRAHPEHFDLVITDFSMPQMTGVDLVREMVSIRPDIPVILCSGFSEMISDEQAKTLGIRAFVMKPLSIQDLAEVARKVLEEKKQ